MRLAREGHDLGLDDVGSAQLPRDALYEERDELRLRGAPSGRTVVGGIDPCAVHARGGERAHEVAIRRRLAREGDHDPCLPMLPTVSEQRLRPAAQKSRAVIERDRPRRPLRGRSVRREPFHVLEHLFDCDEDVSLAST